MDPASFTASLVTLCGAVAVSAKLVYNVRAKFNSAPKDVERLLAQMQNFQGLLNELTAQSMDSHIGACPQDELARIWDSSLLQMQDDIYTLHGTFHKMETLVKRSSKSKFRLRARKLLNETKVADYERRMANHCAFLASVQNAVFKRKLEGLSQTVSSIGDENKTSLITTNARICQSKDQLSTENQTSFAAVSTGIDRLHSAGEARHKETLTRINDQAQIDSVNSRQLHNIAHQQSQTLDTTHTTLSALNGKFTSNSWEHQMTRLAISRLQQLLQLPINLSSRSAHRSPDTIRVVRKYRSNLPCGTLYICWSPGAQDKGSLEVSSPKYVDSDMKVTFVPPPWLSTTAIEYSVNFGSQSNATEWYWGVRLKAIVINNHPVFLNAIKDFDERALIRCFQEGIARPIDNISRDLIWGDRWLGVCCWYEGLNLYKRHERLGSETNSPFLLILRYMIAEGIPGQETYMLHVRMECSGELLESMVSCREMYKDHRGEIAGECSYASNIEFFNQFHPLLLAIKWIPDCLRQSIQPMILDELTPHEICFIGVAAEGDVTFRRWLIQEIASYRSPFFANRATRAAGYFKSVFGTDSMVRHFWKMSCYNQSKFLAAVCIAGSLSILQALLDSGVSMQYTSFHGNILGIAAVSGNVRLAGKLMNAGANGASAISQFCMDGEGLPDALFGEMLELLSKSSQPLPWQFVGPADALHGIMKSRKAIRVCPGAPRILLDHGFGEKAFLLGGRGKPSLENSYMKVAIKNDIPSAIKSLLEHGAHVDPIIGRIFRCYESWCCNEIYEVNCLSTFTWLTFSVYFGSPFATEVLIHHGADIIKLDAGLRSALRLATSNAFGPHPRILQDELCVCGMKAMISAEADIQILATVQNAFELKFGGTISMEEYIATTHQPSIEQAKTVAAVEHNKPQKQKHELQKYQRNTQTKLNKALHLVLTPRQVQRLRKYFEPTFNKIHQLYSLPYFDGLLVRFSYVLSYILLPILALYGVINGEKRILIPSRGAVTIAAVVALAVVWGFLKAED